MVLLNAIQSIDTSIILIISNYLHNSVLDKLMVLITSLGNGGTIWIIISIAMLSSKKYRKVGIMALTAVALTAIFGEGILKHLIRRLRPFASIQTLNVIIKKPLTYSFPSGHTAASFAAAGVIGKHIKKYKLEVYILASLIAFSRIYLFVHYPSDILGGIILGILCYKIAEFIVQNSKVINKA